MSAQLVDSSSKQDLVAVPGPGVLGGLVGVADLLVNGEAAIDRIFDRHGDYVALRLPAAIDGVSKVVVLRDPEVIKPLFTASDEVVDSTRANHVLASLYGNSSLFLIDGPEHRRLRRTLLPPLRDKAIVRWTDHIAATATKRVESMPLGLPVQLHPLMLDDSLEVILNIALGVNGDAVRAWESMHDLLKAAVSEEMTARYLARGLGGIKLWRRYQRLLRECDSLVLDEIAERRWTPEAERSDLLDLLMRAEGEPLTDRELRDQVMTLLIAGHETSATTVSWAFERLVRHPEALARATDEARVGEGTEYIGAVVNETLRLRPPVAFVGRVTLQDLELGPHLIEPNTLVVPYIRGIHRSPALYEDPEEFRPERFLGHIPTAYSLIPFGGGQHRCLGDRLAHHQAVTVIATMLRSLDLQPTDAPSEAIKRKAVTNLPGAGATVTFMSRR